MTPEEARQLIDYGRAVTVKRGTGFSVTGRVIGAVDKPAIVVQTASGNKVVVVMDGTEVDEWV